MAWLSIEFQARGIYVEQISDVLFELGAISVDVSDAEVGTTNEAPIFMEPGEEYTLSWGLNRISSMFADTFEPEVILNNLIDQIPGLRIVEHTITRVGEEDWVRLTQSQFSVIEISNRLRIVPSWIASVDKNGIEIILDPGLAFGTGSHPTTKLCLSWLEKNISGGEVLMDYGCGSGILAIASKKLGAAEVFGIDIDENAIDASRYNAERNNVDISFFNAEDRISGTYDIVVANILSNPLKALAPLLASLVRPKGRVVLSGILAEQESAVWNEYAAWFEKHDVIFDDGWCCLVGVKR
ncbi:MAG: 50S ribosomal protein L11 methyltransferase [Burkholderiales bacterium]